MQLGTVVLLVALVHHNAVDFHVFLVRHHSSRFSIHEIDHFVDVVLLDLLGSFVEVQIIVISHISTLFSNNQIYLNF